MPTLLRRVASVVLLAVGIVFVVFGIASALGFSAVGLVAGIVAIAGLLYAGGVWFGGGNQGREPAHASRVVVFDRGLRVVAGPGTGSDLLAQFPAALRDEVGARCRAALGGAHAHFECEDAGRRRAFDVGPAQTTEGPADYGVLVSDAETM